MHAGRIYNSVINPRDFDRCLEISAAVPVVGLIASCMGVVVYGSECMEDILRIIEGYPAYCDRNDERRRYGDSLQSEWPDYLKYHCINIISCGALGLNSYISAIEATMVWPVRDEELRPVVRRMG